VINKLPGKNLQNAYACDQSLFPTVGSVNPALTAGCLADTSR
jgi:hypothetical protein